MCYFLGVESTAIKQPELQKFVFSSEEGEKPREVSHSDTLKDTRPFPFFWSQNLSFSPKSLAQSNDSIDLPLNFLPSRLLGNPRSEIFGNRRISEQHLNEQSFSPHSFQASIA